MKNLNLFIMTKDKKISAYLLYELVMEIQYNANEKLIDFVNYASEIGDYLLENKLPEELQKKYDKIHENLRFLNSLLMYVNKNNIDTEKGLEALKRKTIEKLQEIEQLYKEIYNKLKL